MGKSPGILTQTEEWLANAVAILTKIGAMSAASAAAGTTVGGPIGTVAGAVTGFLASEAAGWVIQTNVSNALKTYLTEH